MVNLGDLLFSLSNLIDLASPEISKHQINTSYISLEICKILRIPKDLTKNIFIASLFHDIGAITVEEKILLQRFEEKNVQVHALKGELLLKRFSIFKDVAKIVKYHHRRWIDWDEPVETPYVLGSQIILLSDFIERKINRKDYLNILGQTERIRKSLKTLSGKELNKSIIDSFLELSEKEAFWLNIRNPGLNIILYNESPIKKEEIDYDKFEEISKLFRDVIDFKSRFTATHSAGVSKAVEIISQLFGFSTRETQEIRIAANMHDLGKLVIPNYILEKNDILTKSERDIIRSHTYYTYHTVNAIKGQNQIAKWASFHHEKLDGTGYPFHYNADDISLGSRIMAVADIFTALAEDRPYRKGMDEKSIKNILLEYSNNGTLDKRVVKTAIENYGDIYGEMSKKQADVLNFYKNRFKTSEFALLDA